MKQSIRDLRTILFGLTLLMIAVVMVCMTGCSENQSETRLTMEKVVELAQSGNVRGKLKVRMSGMHEAGLKEGIYVGSEGTFIEGDLEYRFSDKPTTQPAGE